ncbi:hypothetical protein PVAP13_8NG203701 [Panicum virgatum]|uniref:Uncharacterized protein n=1 Tax=Panicum virgatum TaxID=38727 RepID=A0A8T0P780_PANVG|nr:hypothetical protein PVAP13_8NG203701 [Panicum virgatum]
MFPGKAACFLFVMAVFAICTEQDKKDVLVNCKLNIKNGKYTPPAPKAGVCCQVLRHTHGKRVPAPAPPPPNRHHHHVIFVDCACMHA